MEGRLERNPNLTENDRLARRMYQKNWYRKNEEVRKKHIKQATEWRNNHKEEVRAYQKRRYWAKKGFNILDDPKFNKEK